jgi:hypothetical protein
VSGQINVCASAPFSTTRISGRETRMVGRAKASAYDLDARRIDNDPNRVAAPDGGVIDSNQIVLRFRSLD